MAKSVYTGISSVARKVKNIYIGVGGVARKVKKAYVGVGGVARLFFSGGGEYVYLGKATDLQSGAVNPASANVGDYGLFAFGGSQSSATISTGSINQNIDFYDTSLTHSVFTPLLGGVIARQLLQGYTTANNAYALLAGGYTTAPAKASGTVNAVNSSKTWTTPTAMAVTRYNFSSGGVGNYVLFGFGLTYQNSSKSSDTSFDTYNTSLTHGKLTTGLVMWGDISEAHSGKFSSYVIFCYSNQRWVFNTSLTMTRLDAESIISSNPYPVGIGNLVVVAASDVVTYYNESLTKGTTTSIDNASVRGNSIENTALFRDTSHASNKQWAYDDSLTQTIYTYATEAFGMRSVRIGNYLLFTGATSRSSDYYKYNKFVDVFEYQ